MRALVTGGGGFLGRYIVEQLRARGDEVRVLGRGAYPELQALGAEIVQADVRSAEAVSKACRGMNAVFHVAAKAGVWGAWQDYYQTNVVGTQNVIAGCRAHGVPQLIYTSSPSVTFAACDQCGIDETAPYASRWLGHYPHTKALAEQAVLAANQRGLSTVALRPHLIWGPRDQHLIPRLLKRAARRRLRRVGAGHNLIDMIYVENAAEAHLQAYDALLAAEKAGTPQPSPAGKAYFLSQGEPVNCWDWINEILALAGLPPVVGSISARKAYAIGAALEGLWRIMRLSGEPPMTRFVAAQLSTSHYFDISAARRDFDFAPTVSTAQGMLRLKNWLQEAARGAK